MPDTYRALAAELDGDAPTIDLHSCRPSEVEYVVDQFIYAMHKKHQPYVRIISGKGSGKLFETTKTFTSKHPLVEKVLDKPGFLVVLLEE